MVLCLPFSFLKHFERFYKSFLTLGKLAVYRRCGRLKRVKWTTLPCKIFCIFSNFCRLTAIHWGIKQKQFGHSYAVSWNVSLNDSWAVSKPHLWLLGLDLPWLLEEEPVLWSFGCPRVSRRVHQTAWIRLVWVVSIQNSLIACKTVIWQ